MYRYQNNPFKAREGSECTEEWEESGIRTHGSPPELGVSTFRVFTSGVMPSSNQRPHHLLKGLHALTFWHLYTYKWHLPFFLSGFVSCQVCMQSRASVITLRKAVLISLPLPTEIFSFKCSVCKKTLNSIGLKCRPWAK